MNTTDPDIIIDLINEIYMMRKLGLAEEGEASIGNLTFKELRSMNMLQLLKDKYYELRSKDLSLNENLTLTSNVKTTTITLEDTNSYYISNNKGE